MWALQRALSFFYLALTNIGILSGLKEGNSTSCSHVFVTMFYNMGSFRDKASAYLDSAVKLVNVITQAKCRVRFYCLGSLFDQGYNCSDYKEAFGNNEYVSMQYTSMDSAMISLYGNGTTVNKVRQIYHSSLEDMSFKKKNRHGDLLSFPHDQMSIYLTINHAKFSVLLDSCREVNRACKNGTCLIFIDAGIFWHKGLSSHLISFRSLSRIHE